MGTVHATYKDGVFTPKEPVSLPDSCDVEFEPRIVSPPLPDAGRLDQELTWLTSRLAADVTEARRRLFSLTPPPAAIPDGKTLSDVVEGTWPGEETDEQVRDALNRLS